MERASPLRIRWQIYRIILLLVGSRTAAQSAIAKWSGPTSGSLPLSSRSRRHALHSACAYPCSGSSVYRSPIWKRPTATVDLGSGSGALPIEFGLIPKYLRGSIGPYVPGPKAAPPDYVYPITPAVGAGSSAQSDRNPAIQTILATSAEAANITTLYIGSVQQLHNYQTLPTNQSAVSKQRRTC